MDEIHNRPKNIAVSNSTDNNIAIQVCHIVYVIGKIAVIAIVRINVNRPHRMLRETVGGLMIIIRRDRNWTTRQ